MKKKLILMMIMIWDFRLFSFTIIYIKMNWLMTLYMALLFFLLTPGVIVVLPLHGTVLTTACVHSIIFAFIYHFTHKIIWNYTKNM
jgi:hypothetical protein